MSDTFCVHPWVNLEVYNTGTYDFCCIAKTSHLTGEDGEILQVEKHTPKEAWNAKSLRQIRKDMLDGKKLDICKNCWYQESIGKESYRKRHNNEWTHRLGKEEIQRRVRYSVDNDYYVDTPPDYLDLRLGSICNLKCRMCNVWNSNQIEKEHLKLKTNNMYADIWSRQYGRDVNITPLSNEWLEAESFWEQLHEYIPTLKKVYFTGGEPTLVQSNYSFMEEMIDQGFQNKIDLFFNTNCTNVQPRWLETLSKFKNVQINASIDGVGPVNDYIRAPSNWSAIYKNFIDMANLRNVRLDISPVIQTYNILDIGNILNLAQETSHKTGKIVDVDFLLCNSPFHLDPLNLDDNVRTTAFLKLQKWQDSWIYKKSPITKNSIDSYLTLLESERNIKWKQNMEDFWNITSIHDKNRNQSFEKSIPELYGLLK